jgi:hypothetical protein
MTISYLDSVVPLPLMPLPVRTPVVHLANADVLISPGSRLTPAQFASAGRITDLVGPSFLHLGGMRQAIACLPGARVWGPEGAKVRRKKIAWSGELSAATWPYQDELPMLELGGMAKVREVLFFHRASRTLIVTDLCFNLLDAHGLGARFILGLFGTYQRLGVSRLFLRFVTDRALFEASLRTLFAWEFDDIAISHGRQVEGGGRARLLAALQERGYCKDVK